MNNLQKEQTTKKIAFIGRLPSKRKEQMKATPEALRKKSYVRKEQTTNEKFIELYLRFKDKCLGFGIEDINEIIKLFEVWARTCS